MIVSKLFYFNVSSAEQFNFDVTEIEISQNGEVIKGVKKGTINTNNGITIKADTFIYKKLLNTLTAEGNVLIKDAKSDVEIYSDNVIYNKNKEIIIVDENNSLVA